MDSVCPLIEPVINDAPYRVDGVLTLLGPTIVGLVLTQANDKL